MINIQEFCGENVKITSDVGAPNYTPKIEGFVNFVKNNRNEIIEIYIFGKDENGEKKWIGLPVVQPSVEWDGIYL
jgi:hypothetical protein